MQLNYIKLYTFKGDLKTSFPIANKMVVAYFTLRSYFSFLQSSTCFWSNLLSTFPNFTTHMPTPTVNLPWDNSKAHFAIGLTIILTQNSKNKPKNSCIIPNEGCRCHGGDGSFSPLQLLFINVSKITDWLLFFPT